MDEEEASASPAWRYEPFADDREAPPTYHPTGLSFDDHYDDRQSPAREQYEPRTRYHLERQATPSFESALRSHARPPIERASSSAVHSHTAGLHLPRVDNMASSATRRFEGDGFDYRRPAGSARNHEAAASVDLTGEEDMAIDLSQDDDVIDLTADDSGYGASHDGHNAREQHRHRQQESHHGRRHAPRLPRGMDIIIDLDNGDEEWNVDAPAPEPSSPEIEFISSRTIPGRRLPLPTHGNENNSDGDEVEFVRANALPEAEQRRRQRNQELDNVMDLFGTLNGRFTHLRAQVDRFHAQINRTAHQFNEPIAPARSASRGRAPHVRVGAFMAPVLDFDVIGFELNPRAREAPPPPPTYSAPPKAPEGFTRSPEEDGGALICPNCEEELCVGGDETKRQVWIVKGCGHVSHYSHNHDETAN